MQLERQLQHEQLESKLLIRTPNKTPKSQNLEVSPDRGKSEPVLLKPLLLEPLLSEPLLSEPLLSEQLLSKFSDPERGSGISFDDAIQARSFSFDVMPVMGMKKINRHRKPEKDSKNHRDPFGKNNQFDTDFDIPVLKKQKMDYGVYDPNKRKITTESKLPPLYPVMPQYFQNSYDSSISKKSNKNTHFNLLSNRSSINLEPSSIKKSISHSKIDTVIPARARFLNQISKLQENRITLSRERSHMLEIERARRAFVGKIDDFFAPSRQVRRLKENLRERVSSFFGKLKAEANVTSENDVAEFDRENLKFRNCRIDVICPWVDLDIEFLGGYGCHCSFGIDQGGSEGSEDFRHTHGPVQDEFDNLCKQMASCYRCVEIDVRQSGEDGGWCEEGSSRSPIDAVGYTVIKGTYSDSRVFDECADSNRYRTNCVKKLCTCESHFAHNIVKLMLEDRHKPNSNLLQKQFDVGKVCHNNKSKRPQNINSGNEGKMKEEATFNDPLELSSRSAGDGINHAEVADFQGLNGEFGEITGQSGRKLDSNGEFEGGGGRDVFYSDGVLDLENSDYGVFFDLMNDRDELRIMGADSSVDEKDSKIKHVPEYHHKCCGDYPQRYPYFAGDHDSRKCCGRKTYDSKMFECCSDRHVRPVC